MYKARYSQTVLGMNTEFYPKKTMERYAYKNGYCHCNSGYATTFMTHAIFLSDENDDFALSSGIGGEFGGDLTAKIYMLPAPSIISTIWGAG